MSEATTISIPDHALVRPIGKGAFGEVWLARSAVGTYRAVKIVSRNEVDAGYGFQREFNGIQRFEPVSRNCQGLIDVLQIGRAANESYFYYVMELGDDVEPRQEFAPDQYQPRTLTADCRRKKRIPATEAALIGAQLADALGFLHGQGLIHRDIKPSNVLFVQGQARIGDPGLVTAIEASQSMGGTLGFIPPEGPGTPQADIFSLGKLLYVISTGKEPGEFPFLPAEMTSFADAEDLRRLNLIIVRACEFNPKARYATAQELRKDLLEVHAGGSPGEARRLRQIFKRIGAIFGILLVLAVAGYARAQYQAAVGRGRLAKKNLETAARLQKDNNSIAALPFLGDILAMNSPNKRDEDAAARRIGFIWRYSPRLLAQWYFTNTVNRIVFTPSGEEVCGVSASGEVWRWQWRESTPQPLGLHTEAQTMAINREGSWLATAGTDNSIRFWPLAGKGATNRMLSFAGPANAIAFHPGNNQIAIGCNNMKVLLADAGWQRTQILFTAESNVLCVAFHPNGTELIAGDRGGSGYVANLTNSVVVRTNKLLWDYDVAYNRDGSLFAVASGNRAHLNQPIGKIRHAGLVRSVSFDPTKPPGTDRLLTSCLDRTVRLWSCAEDVEIMPPIFTHREPSCAVFAPDGTTFAVSTHGGIVRVYSLPPSTGSHPDSPLSLSTDGSRYAKVQDQTNVLVFDSSTDRKWKTVSLSGLPVSSIELNKNGTRLLTTQKSRGEPTHFELWDLSDRVLVATTNFNEQVMGSLNPDGTAVAFRQLNQLLLWLPAVNITRIWRWELKQLSYDHELRFSEGSSRLVVCWSTNLMVLSTSQGDEVASWRFFDPVFTADIDPKGERVLAGLAPTGFSPSTNFVLEVSSRKQLSPPLVFEDGIFLARFSPAGTWVILADEQKNCVLYDTRTWKAISLQDHFGIVNDATFSPDNHFVATVNGTRGGAMRAIRTWDLPTGTAFAPPLFLGQSGSGRLRFSASGDMLSWFSSAKGDWYHWKLGKLDGSSKDLADLALLLSCRRITEREEFVPVHGKELDALWQRLWTSHPDWFSAPDASQISR